MVDAFRAEKKETAERLNSILYDNVGNVDHIGNISADNWKQPSDKIQTTVNKPAFLKQNVIRKLLNTNGIYYHFFDRIDHEKKV